MAGELAFVKLFFQNTFFKTQKGEAHAPDNRQAGKQPKPNREKQLFPEML